MEIKVNETQKPYVIIRGKSSGVFVGFLEYRKKKEVTLSNCRRIWYWKGAASLSELAIRGVKYPNECKFPIEIESLTILDAIEIILCSTTAFESIKNVPEWKS